MPKILSSYMGHEAKGKGSSSRESSGFGSGYLGYGFGFGYFGSPNFGVSLFFIETPLSMGICMFLEWVGTHCLPLYERSTQASPTNWLHETP